MRGNGQGGRTLEAEQMLQELEDPTVLEGSDLLVIFRLSSNVSVLMGSSNAVQRRSLQVVVDQPLWRGSFNSFFLRKSLMVSRC